MVSYVLVTHLAQDQQGAPGHSLSDSFDEFINGYDPGRRDRIVTEVENLDYHNGAADAAGDVRRVPPQAVRYADPDALALGYTISIALVGQEEWCDSHDWRLYADLIDAAQNPDIGPAVDVYIPDDTAEKIVSRTNLSRDDIHGFMDELEKATYTFAVESGHGKSVAGGDSLPASSAAAVAAGDQCPPNTVYATYSRHARRMAEDYGGIEAADPADIYAGLQMNHGAYETAEMSRAASAVEWFATPHEYQQGRVPPALVGEPTVDEPDVAVIDESAGKHTSRKESRNNAEWSDTLRFIDSAVAETDIDVYLPEGLSQQMKEDIGGDPGRRVREDLRSLTEQLPVPDPATLDIPDRFAGMEGDYAIAQAAQEQGDTVLVVTYDDHFCELPGVVAASPRGGMAAIQSEG